MLRIRIEPKSHADTFDKFRTSQAVEDSTNEQLSPNVSSCWAIVTSTHGSAFCAASEETLRSLSPANVKDVQWYFEEYLLRDPFSTARAETIRRRLRQYAKNLIRDFVVPQVYPKNLSSANLIIEIRDARYPRVTHANNSLHRFYWEALEDPTVWDEFGASSPLSICVVRVHLPDRHHVPSQAALTQPLESSRGGAKNVLAITSRPSHLEDIPHRLITRSIAAAISTANESSASGVSLEIVRPGTFSALDQHLHNYPPGHFDIIHLDLHGEVDDQGSKLLFVKYDAYGRPHRDDRTAEELVHLLVKCDVRVVIINACRSASTLRSSESFNVARALVKAGIDVAIGMSFNVLSSTAAHFMQVLYQGLLGEGLPAIIATQNARQSLRKRPPRTSKFSSSYELEDHIVPSIHCNEPAVHETLDMQPHETVQIRSESIQDKEEYFFGREGNLLEIESFLSQRPGLKIHLHGPPGVGKTSLLEHAAAWWRETGFYSRVVQIQMHETDCNDMNIEKLLALIGSQLGINCESELYLDILDVFDKPGTLLILDSLESVKWPSDGSDYQYKKNLRGFLLSLRKCSVIFASRHTEKWLGHRVCPTWLKVEPLNPRSSMDYALALLRKDSTIAITRDNRDFFDQLVDLAHGNPLAIRILILDMIKHFSSDQDVTIESHLLSLLQTQPLHIDLDAFKNNPGGRAVSQLLNLYTPARDGTRLVEWKDIFRKELRVSCDKTCLRESYIKKLLMLSLAAFWHNVPGKLEPFTSMMAALRIARSALSTDDYTVKRIRLHSCLESAAEKSQPLRETINHLMKSIVDSLTEPIEAWRSIAQHFEAVMVSLLQQELSDFVELLVIRDREPDDVRFFQSFHVISPLLTLVALGSPGPNQRSAGFMADLKLARSAPYRYQLTHFASHAAGWPGMPRRESAKLELAFDFFNQLSLIISCQDLNSLVDSEEVYTQSLLSDVAAMDTRRIALMLFSMERFLSVAIARLKEIREEVLGSDPKEYHLNSQKTEPYKWRLACCLEIACTGTISHAIALSVLAMRPIDHLVRFWRVLVYRPMLPQYKVETDGVKEFIRIKQIQETKLIDMFEGESLGTNMFDKVMEAARLISDAQHRLLGSELGLSGRSESSPLPSHTQVRDFHFKQLGLQNSRDGRVGQIINALETGSPTREALQEAIPKLEEILSEEIESSNNLGTRWNIHSQLAVLHTTLGNTAIALQHRMSKNEIFSALDPSTQTMMEKVGRTMALYHHNRLDSARKTKPETLEQQLARKRAMLDVSQSDPSTDKLSILEQQESIAGTLSLLGRRTEAANNYREVIKERQRHFPFDDPRTLTSMTTLADILAEKQDYTEPIRLGRIVRNAYHVMPGKRLDYLNATESLAGYLFRYVQFSGDFLGPEDRRKYLDEAEGYFKESIANDGAVRGLGGRGTSGSMRSLSWLCTLQGRYAEAEKWAKEAVDLTAAISSNIKSGLLNQNSLALTWGRMGKKKEAEQLFEWVLDRHIEFDGYRGKNTLSVLANLILQYQESKHNDKVKNLLNRFIPEFYKSLHEGFDNQESLQELVDIEYAKYNLGRALKMANCFAECVSLLEEIIPRWEPDETKHKDLADVYGQIASCYGKPELQDWTRALEFRMHQKQLCEKIYGSKHLRTLQTIAAEAINLNMLHRNEEAIARQRFVVEGTMAACGADHTDTLIERYNLGNFLNEVEDCTASQQILQPVYDILSKVAPTWPYTILTARALGRAYATLEQHYEAATYYRIAGETYLNKEPGSANPAALVDLNRSIENFRIAADFIKAREVLAVRLERGDGETDRLHCSLLEATLQRREGHLSVSEDMVRKVLEERPPPRSTGDVIRTRAFGQLASIYEERKQFSRAIELWLEAIEERRRVTVNVMPTAHDLLGNLTDAYVTAEQWVKAEQALLERMQIVNTLLSPQARASTQRKCQELLARVQQEQRQHS